MKNISLIILFLTTIVSTGCIETSTPTTPKRIDLEFMVENVGNHIEMKQDSIRINEIKLLGNRFNVIDVNEAVIETEVKAIVISYRDTNQDKEELVLSANIGFEDFERFKAMQIFISPPEDEDVLTDDNFLGTDQNYSFVLKGAYNDRSFTFQMATTFDKLFQFEEVSIDNEDETLVLQVLLDMKDLLIDTEKNEIIIPNQEHIPVFDSLLQKNIRLRVFPDNRIF